MRICSLTIKAPLARDPELKQSNAGVQYVTTSIAISKGREKPTAWIKLMAMETGNRAVFEALRDAQKGQWATLRGDLSYDEWTDQEQAQRPDWTMFLDFIDVPPPREGQQQSRQSEPQGQSGGGYGGNSGNQYGG